MHTSRSGHDRRSAGDPYDGQTGVPTNARIVVAYSASSTVTDHLALRSSDGAPVAVTASQSGFVLTPVASLEPNTQYQVLSELAVLPCEQDPRYLSAVSLPACTSQGDAGVVDGGGAIDGGAQSFVIATFSTGAGPDLTPPVLTGNVSVTTSNQSCIGGGCCVDFTGVAFTLAWTAATDDTGVAHYEISNQTGSGGDWTFSTLVMGLAFCTGYGPGLGFQSFVGTAGTYQVVAVDLAGNRSAPVNAVVDIDCSVRDAGADVFQVDAAHDEGGDTGAVDVTPNPDTAKTPAKVSGSGCSCRIVGGRQDSAGALVAFLALLLIVRRRSA